MKNLLFTLLSLVALSGAAQSVAFNQGQATTKNYYEELPYDDINGKLFINVEVNGKMHRFLLDTGAPLMVTGELADEVKAPLIHQADLVDVNGGHIKQDVVTMEVKIGGTIFTGIPAIKGIPGDLLKCWNIDGIIGSNLLRRSIVCFNVSRHMIVITDQADKLSLNKANSGKMSVHYDIQSTPLITVAVGKKVEMSVDFDSGDNKFLRLTDELIVQMSKAKAYTLMAKGSGASTVGMMGLQKIDDKQRVSFPSMDIGGQHFNNAISETSKTGIPGIGTGLLKYGNMTLDYIHEKYYFDPITPSVDLDTKVWPLYLTVNDNKLIIGVVWDKLTGQVKPGEQVTAIDGVAYDKMTICDMADHPSPLEGKDTATLTIKDANGTTRQLTIKRE